MTANNDANAATAAVTPGERLMADESSAQTESDAGGGSASSSSARSFSGIRFPAYDLADRYFRQNAFESVRRADPFFGQIKIIESDHAGPIRSVGGATPFDSPQRLHSATASIAVADIEHMNFAAYSAMVQGTADQLMEAFAKNFFTNMDALTSHVGNVVDQKGKSLFEQFKEGMMKVALDFDDEGMLVPKQLVVSPVQADEAQVAMQQVFADPEVRAHVLAEREKFLANRGQRRLLSPC